MAVWNPWRGCHKYSDGCKFCYIHKGDKRKGINTGNVIKTGGFYAPIVKNKNGTYKMKSGICYICFSSDFLIEDADCWRNECWEMIRQRPDITFLFLTKRIDRFLSCIPHDWGKGYENVAVGCTVENQAMADYRLKIFRDLPIRHKNIICQPMISRIDLSQYLNDIELVVVGGESDKNARILDYNWVLDIKKQCMNSKTAFEFRQLGTHFLKDGKLYTLKTHDLCSQAKKAGINYYPDEVKKY